MLAEAGLVHADGFRFPVLNLPPADAAPVPFDYQVFLELFRGLVGLGKLPEAFKGRPDTDKGHHVKIALYFILEL